jgi:hypothetical protein
MSTLKTALLCNSAIWLLDLHTPLRRYMKNDDVNPWFTFDIQKAIVERDFDMEREAERPKQKPI